MSGRRPCAGAACSARRRTTRAMSASIWPIRSSPSPSASTVRAPSTVSVSVALICGVGRVLAQVAVLGARRGTTAGRRPAAGRRAGTGSATHQPTLQRGAEVSTAVTTAIVHSGSAQRTDQPSCVDVAAGAGQQVAGAGRLHDADREGERVRRSPRAARPAPARRAPGRRSARTGSAPPARPGTRRAAARSGRRGRWWCRPRPPGPGRRAAAARPAPASAAQRRAAPARRQSRRGCRRAIAAGVPAHRAAVGDRQRRAHAAPPQLAAVGLAGHDGAVAGSVVEQLAVRAVGDDPAVAARRPPGRRGRAAAGWWW